MAKLADENSPLCPKKDNPGNESGGLPKVKLQRTIGILSASAILFGNCIGAGIFISPRGVYEKTGSSAGGLLVWALAGIIVTLCTVTYAELGTMMQESGGEFVYLLKAFGKVPAFCFSFCTSLLIKPAAMCIVTLTFADYLTEAVWGISNVWMSRAIATSAIVLMTVMNMMSVKFVVKFCSILSVMKLALVGFLLTCGLTILIRGEAHIENFRISTSFIGSSTNPADYALAFYFAIFSFQGWNSLNFMNEELKTPERSLPIGGFIGLSGVSLSYMLCNIAYVMLFSVGFITESNTIAMDCGYIAFGNVGKMIMAVGLMISAFGCVCGSILSIARNIQSTAEKGLFPQWASWISPTFHTPVPALIITALTLMFYMMFDATLLIPCLGTAEWFFYCVTFAALLYLRYKEPNARRPVKMPIVIPIALFVITLTLVILPLFNAEKRITAIAGFGSVVLAAVVYGFRCICLRTCCYTPSGREQYKKLRLGSSSDSSTDSGYADYKPVPLLE